MKFFYTLPSLKKSEDAATVISIQYISKIVICYVHYKLIQIWLVNIWLIVSPQLTRLSQLKPIPLLYKTLLTLQESCFKLVWNLFETRKKLNGNTHVLFWTSLKSLVSNKQEIDCFEQAMQCSLYQNKKDKSSQAWCLPPSVSGYWTRINITLHPYEKCVTSKALFKLIEQWYCLVCTQLSFWNRKFRKCLFSLNSLSSCFLTPYKVDILAKNNTSSALKFATLIIHIAISIFTQ